MKKFLFLLATLLAAGGGLRADDGLLRVAGTGLVDRGGHPVVLRGVNLGGWLVEEPWMMSFQTKPPAGSTLGEIRDHASLWRIMESRYGTAGAAEIRDKFRRTWITEDDFARIEAAGLNVVRLPFLYDLLEEKDGYAWLDQAVAFAAKHHLYVILDLHGAPGRQSKEMHTGEAGVNRLFKSEKEVQATEQVWRAVAEHFRSNPAVAGYDLLNEPMGAATSADVYRVEARLYQAVRSVDAQHLIIMEDGYKGLESMPSPHDRGWTNVMLSSHSYKFDAKTEADQLQNISRLITRIQTLQTRTGVPFYLGEFNVEPHGTPETIARMTGSLEQNKISWSLWTYKTAMVHGGGGLWGVYIAPKTLPVLDPFRDSKETLLKKIDLLATPHFLVSGALPGFPAGKDQP